MNAVKQLAPGIGICLLVALPCWFLGEALPIVGGPVFAILAGMGIAAFWSQPKRGNMQAGISFTGKKVLQWAVILLGFGLNLAQIARVGAESLPIIASTIATALIAAFVMHRILHTDAAIATLVGVGSSICGGSAIAATAPVIRAKDEDVAQAISVIFLFNVVAALIFPTLGNLLGMSNEGFGLFAGTAVNDTSSVTAAAAAWDGMHPGANSLDDATIVKLTRTLAIIPITLALSIFVARRDGKASAAADGAKATAVESAAGIPHAASRKSAVEGHAVEREEGAGQNAGGADAPQGFSLKRALPSFIVFFLAASVVTTIAVACGVNANAFSPLKTLSKFFIVMAMAAIGLNTDIVKLVKSGGKPLLMGLVCWVCIAAVSLGMQHLLGLW